MIESSDQLSLEQEFKYRKYIRTRLENKDGLASILFKLKNYGLEHDFARKLVIDETFVYSRKIKLESTAKIAFSILVVIVLVLFGISLSNQTSIELYAYSVAPGIFSIYQWRTSNKRIKYLSSLSK